MSVIAFEWNEISGVGDELVKIRAIREIAENSPYFIKHNSRNMPPEHKYNADDFIARLIWYMYVANRVAYTLSYKDNADIFPANEDNSTQYNEEEALSKFSSLMYNIYTQGGQVFLSEEWLNVADKIYEYAKKNDPNYYAKGGEVAEYYSKMVEKLGKEGAFIRVLKDSGFNKIKGTPQNEFRHNREKHNAIITDNYVEVVGFATKDNPSFSKQFTSAKELAEYLDKNQLYTKGGEVAEKETIVASYDINEYLDGQATYWKEKKDEFIEHLDLDEEEAKEVDDDYIDKHVWGDEGTGEWLYEDLQQNLEEEFEDKLGKHVIVGGRNMGWRNLEGTKTFELDNTEQMMREIVPENSDFTYYLYKTGDNNYSAKVSHHDSPMGEHYELHIMPQKYVDEFYEKWENEEAGMENYDEDDMGEWYKEEILSKKGMGGTLLTAAVAGYVGYKVGRARPQKTGFSTEKKIAAQIQKEMKEMQKKRAQKKRAKSNIVDVEFEEIKARGGEVSDTDAYEVDIRYSLVYVQDDPEFVATEEKNIGGQYIIEVPKGATDSEVYKAAIDNLFSHYLEIGYGRLDRVKDIKIIILEKLDPSEYTEEEEDERSYKFSQSEYHY